MRYPFPFLFLRFLPSVWWCSPPFWWGPHVLVCWVFLFSFFLSSLFLSSSILQCSLPLRAAPFSFPGGGGGGHPGGGRCLGQVLQQVGGGLDQQQGQPAVAGSRTLPQAGGFQLLQAKTATD